MGGAIAVPGNITPVGEFNCIADPVAAARVFALTGLRPECTMPPEASGLGPYPPPEELGKERLNVALFPLDITTPHTLGRDEVVAKTKPLIEKGSPLAEWVGAFLAATFAKSEALYHDSGVFVCFHDPVVVWYAISSEREKESEKWAVEKGEDIRVETGGQWTRGMCVVDRRGMRMVDGEGSEGKGGGGRGGDGKSGDAELLEAEGEKSGDSGGWLSIFKGNRLSRCIGTPGARVLAGVMLDTIFA